MTKKLSLLVPAILCATVLAASAASVRIKTDKTPMRASADAKAAVLLELKAGAVLEMIDANRDWFKVRDPQTKKEGFVLASAVELLPGPASAAAGAAGQKPAAPTAASKAAKPTKPAKPVKPGDWTDYGYFTVNGIYEGGSSAFTQTQSWQSFAETATVTVSFPAKNAAGFDVGGGYRFWRNLALGVELSTVSRSTTATINGSLPNPLYLNRPIALSGGIPSNNTETAIHLHAVWAIPVSPKMTLMVSGGPSIFSVKQTIVEPQGIGLTSGYPFTSGEVTSANTTDATKTAVGFGAGADVAYYFSRIVGVGGMIRYARASVSFPVDGQPSVTMNAGGFQAGAGLRLRFPSIKPAPKPPARPQPKPDGQKKK
jgi:hypothetical protein